MNNAIWTYWISDATPAWVRIAKKSISSYAKRIGAEHIHTTDRWHDPRYHINFESTRAFQDTFLDDYDNVLVLDMDMLVSPRAPNIFEVTDGKFAGVAGMLSPQREGIRSLIHEHHGDTKGKWFGGGTVVWDKETRLFARDNWLSIDDWMKTRSLYRGPGTLMEQPYLNANIAMYHPEIVELGREWNSSPRQHPHKKHIVHFTGQKKQFMKNWSWNTTNMCEVDSNSKAEWPIG